MSLLARLAGARTGDPGELLDAAWLRLAGHGLGALLTPLWMRVAVLLAFVQSAKYARLRREGT